jgi:hypothetical protein
MAIEIMIDLETVGQKFDAGILTIGAIKFKRDQDFSKLLDDDDPNAEQIASVTDNFYRRISGKSIDEVNKDNNGEFDFTADDGTMEWWGKQPEAARHEAFNAKPRVHIRDMLKDFADWIGGREIMWSHGSDFDLVLLQTAYRYCGYDQVPWNFWNSRDTRTFYDMTNINIKSYRSSRHHHALIDCWDQIIGVQQGFKNLEQKLQ